ncbi:hypothetical protein SASPL_132951 [Salvia splendens]|uniref:Uncharacterized protein n=1 Tax=Salvia splendens TaxID=180675 RepID=A0A8X8ZHM0_SALSN|nr:hypothetical protein SASPL_132951 [Salvia splendens]
MPANGPNPSYGDSRSNGHILRNSDPSQNDSKVDGNFDNRFLRFLSDVSTVSRALIELLIFAMVCPFEDR